LGGALSHFGQALVHAQFAQHDQAVLFAQHLVDLADLVGDGTVQRNVLDGQRLGSALGHAFHSADGGEDLIVGAAGDLGVRRVDLGAFLAGDEADQLPGSVLLVGSGVDGDGGGGADGPAGFDAFGVRQGGDAPVDGALTVRD